MHLSLSIVRSYKIYPLKNAAAHPSPRQCNSLFAGANAHTGLFGSFINQCWQDRGPPIPLRKMG